MLLVRQSVVNEFAAKAREAYGGGAIEEIILFGSVARGGDDRPDSDIDILVITSGVGLSHS